MALLGLAVVGYLFLAKSNGPQGSFVASGPGYVCDTLLTPGPADTLPPPAPSTTPTLTSTASPSSAASIAAQPSTTAPASAGASTAPTGPASDPPSPAASESPAASDTPAASATPAASTTPEPAPTLRLGFTTEILGRTHVQLNDTIEYGFCPPTSGNHYNSTGRGPIRAAVYPKTAEQPPGGWIHNLEHGWVVMLYRCTGSNDCPSDAEMAQMQALFDQAPTQSGCDRELLVARFDSMDTRFAELAWGRAMLTDDFSLDNALTFAQQWMDQYAPEKATC